MSDECGDKGSFSVARFVFGLLSLPFSFLAGVVTGMSAPLAAIAGMVGGLYLVTGKVPSLVPGGADEAGHQQFTFRLVAPERARELFEEQKTRIGGEIGHMRTEIEAAVKESKGQK